MEIPQCDHDMIQEDCDNPLSVVDARKIAAADSLTLEEIDRAYEYEEGESIYAATDYSETHVCPNAFAYGRTILLERAAEAKGKSTA